MTTVVGLDLSITATGVCSINDDGTPRVRTVRSVPPKPASLANQVSRLDRIRQTVVGEAYGADLVLVEGPSYGSKGAAVHQIAGNWWLIVSELLAMGLAVGVASPSVVKKFATGKGTADKVAVAVALSRLWPGQECANDNEWDSLALATIGAQRLGISVPSRAHQAACLESVEWPETLPLAA